MAAPEQEKTARPLHIHALFLPTAQPQCDERVTQRMNGRLGACLSRSNASFVNESAEALPQSFVCQTATVTGHKERGGPETITHQFAMTGIDTQLFGSRRVKRNNPRLVKLGFADEQCFRAAPGHDVHAIKPECF